MLPMIYMTLVDDKDIPAFEELYEKCKEKAYMTAYDILNDHTLTEECVSEVFLAIARNFQKVNNLTSYEKLRYIVISSRNRSLDIKEKEQKHRDTEPYDEESYPDEKALSEINMTAWKELIKMLKPTDKDILYLRYIKNLEYKDISELLGISTSAAKQRFWEAKRKLIKMLDEEAEE